MLIIDNRIYSVNEKQYSEFLFLRKYSKVIFVESLRNNIFRARMYVAWKNRRTTP